MQGTWIKKPTGDCTVVFIHGILSSGDSCWRHKNGTYWPKLLADDIRVKSIGIYEFTYKTGLFSGAYRLGDVVDALKEFLGLDGILESKKVIFVCHSMGGIVVRKYIVERAASLMEAETTFGLFLVASPSLGSDYANWLTPLTRLFGHTQAGALRFSQNNAWLMDLDREFINAKEGGRLNIIGKELVEDSFITLKLIFRTQVVQPVSGARYFGEPFKVPNTDHFSVAKVEDAEAIQHRLLVKFVQEISNKTGHRPAETSAAKRVVREISRELFSASVTTLGTGNGLRCAVYCEQRELSFAEALQLWQNDYQFVEFFLSIFRQCGYHGYVWETPPLTQANILRQFEFVIHRAPRSSQVADQATYAEYFENVKKQRGIVSFENLGGDALLIVPSPPKGGINYGGLPQFLENAPIDQQHELWREVGKRISERLTDSPVWVSVAGGGIQWLHVRLDSVPKYYRHHPYTIDEFSPTKMEEISREPKHLERTSRGQTSIAQTASAGTGSTIIQVGGNFKKIGE